MCNEKKQVEDMLVTGMKYTSEAVVVEANTAAEMGSGDMQVFATPAMVALMENAAMNAVAYALASESATVGSLINVSHIKPSPLGMVVKATAELVEIDGRKLTFKVMAEDDGGMIGEGTHVRYVVDKAKFLSKL